MHLFRISNPTIKGGKTQKPPRIECPIEQRTSYLRSKTKPKQVALKRITLPPEAQKKRKILHSLFETLLRNVSPPHQFLMPGRVTVKNCIFSPFIWLSLQTRRSLDRRLFLRVYIPNPIYPTHALPKKGFHPPNQCRPSLIHSQQNHCQSPSITGLTAPP
ncbi:hypothetical protein TNIN_128091 [Trichonephila inaurata madagascariensis]|uniref:Uncharacterized protein n=1 Tax=Trichonephila inaurata madagascariensis TaxID=2747483 RepID=A0A8X6XQD0_9ARAC|nr:hypothetical protein TNIN_128091 [Trichonephila inaurata madagascariensis]